MEKLSIRLAKSLIGRGKEQIAVAQSLGLHRPGDVVELAGQRCYRRQGRQDLSPGRRDQAVRRCKA